MSKAKNHTILNRAGLKVVVQVDDDTAEPSKLVFIAHGMKGTMDQPHIDAFARAFVANGYRVVRFDATHSIGQSDGAFEDVTYDSYIHDLEDVIEWAKKQDWFVSPFVLCGHSMGAQSTTWYAENHPQNVSMLLPMAPTINFDLHTATMTPEYLADWKKSGFQVFTSSKFPGKKFSIPWAYEESLKRYDILPKAGRLAMPILIIVGSEDAPCPPKHQQVFIDRIASSNKTLIIVDGLQHSYLNDKTNQVDEGLKEVETIMTGWIRTTSLVR